MSQMICLHTVTGDMPSYCHGWYAFILSQMICLHTVTDDMPYILSQLICLRTVTGDMPSYCHRRYAFILSQMICLHTVTDDMPSFCHRWYAFILSQMICLHTVTDDMPSYCHRWYAFILSRMICLHTVTDDIPSYTHGCVPGLYYKQRAIDFLIVCFVEDPPVISFWCSYFSFCVDKFLSLSIRAVFILSLTRAVTKPTPWTPRGHGWEFSHFDGQAHARI